MTVESLEARELLDANPITTPVDAPASQSTLTAGAADFAPIYVGDDSAAPDDTLAASIQAQISSLVTLLMTTLQPPLDPPPSSAGAAGYDPNEGATAVFYPRYGWARAVYAAQFSNFQASGVYYGPQNQWVTGLSAFQRVYGTPANQLGVQARNGAFEPIVVVVQPNGCSHLTGSPSDIYEPTFSITVPQPVYDPTTGAIVGRNLVTLTATVKIAITINPR